MKKTLILILAIVLLSSSAYAACPCSANKDLTKTADSDITGYAAQDSAMPDAKQAGQQNASAEKTIQQNTSAAQTGYRTMEDIKEIQERERAREHVEEMIQQKQQQLNQKIQNKSNKTKYIYKHQNRIRLAVHSLLAMENLTGGIGPQVSAIAKEFNNSVNSTLKLEKKIENRSRVARFFAGGDNEAGQELEQIALENQNKIQQLKQYKEQCSCDNETKAMMQEQIMLMQNEISRLQLLAENEQNSKGLFGWLWK